MIPTYHTPEGFPVNVAPYAPTPGRCVPLPLWSAVCRKKGETRLQAEARRLADWYAIGTFPGDVWRAHCRGEFRRPEQPRIVVPWITWGPTIPVQFQNRLRTILDLGWEYAGIPIPTIELATHLRTRK